MLLAINVMLMIVVAVVSGTWFSSTTVGPATSPQGMTNSVSSAISALLISTCGCGALWIASVFFGVRGLASVGQDRSLAVLSLAMNFGGLLVISGLLTFALFADA